MITFSVFVQMDRRRGAAFLTFFLKSVSNNNRLAQLANQSRLGFIQREGLKEIQALWTFSKLKVWTWIWTYISPLNNNKLQLKKTDCNKCQVTALPPGGTWQRRTPLSIFRAYEHIFCSVSFRGSSGRRGATFTRLQWVTFTVVGGGVGVFRCEWSHCSIWITASKKISNSFSNSFFSPL